MKQHIQEALSNLDHMIEVDAVTNPVTAQLKKDMKKKYDDFKDMTETDDNYLGAEKQPVPDKVEVPRSEAKLDLNEALFGESIDDFIREYLTHHPFDSAEEMIEYFEDNDEIEELEDRFHTDVIGAIEEYFEDNHILNNVPSISDLTKVKDVDEDVSIFVDEYNNVYYIVDETNQTILDGGFKSDKEAMDLYTEYTEFMDNESLTEAINAYDISDDVDNVVKELGWKLINKEWYSTGPSVVVEKPGKPVKTSKDKSELRKQILDKFNELYGDKWEIKVSYIQNDFKEPNRFLFPIKIVNKSLKEDTIKPGIDLGDYGLDENDPDFEAHLSRLGLLDDDDDDIDESLKEELLGKDYTDLKSDVYNALSEIVYKYEVTKELPIDHIDISGAVDQFIRNFFVDDDDDDIDESLKEDYSEDELEQAINVIKKYYHNDLHSFLESFVFNSPIADSEEIIKELADYISDDDYYDESLKKSRVQHSINEKREKVVQTPEERAEEGGLWTTVYNELSGDASFFKPSLGSRGSKYGREKSNPYPKYEEILPTDTGMRIYGSSEEDFDFAKQVADDYNLYYWVDENENNFDDDPERKYYIDIDIEQ